MLNIVWPEGWSEMLQVELRAEAIGLAARGWPVMPGTVPVDQLAGRDGEVTWPEPTPIHDEWRAQLDASPEQAASWWSGQTQSLLLATGVVADAIEVDAAVGKRAASLLRATGNPAPILALPNGRWIFLTTVADAVPNELAISASVRWHGLGSWIPLPPTPLADGVAHWRVKPEMLSWRMPAADNVHDLLVRALDDSRSESQELGAPALAV